MNALIIIIPIALALSLLILWFFLWAGKKDQFDDVEGPKYRMLEDDDE
jgi:cbb3-type cytochrome oxidase maturation protein